MQKLSKLNRKYRIGIDARFYGPKYKGLGRYTQRLIENLELIDDSNEYIIFLRKDNWDEYTPKNTNFKKVLADFRWYTFAEQIFMPQIIKRQKLDLMHFTHFNVPIFYRGKFIVTIHDLILKKFPTVKHRVFNITTLNPLFYWFKEKAYNFVINYAVKNSERIIAVSNFTKKDVESTFGISPKKINVIYEGASFQYDEAGLLEIKSIFENSDLQKFKIKTPYILYVGNAYPHKNLEGLIKAFKLVFEKRKDLQLVLVGGMDYFYKNLQNFIKTNFKQIEDKIIITNDLSDAELVQIYKNTSLYVFPSFYEGFGLPPLEAMNFGIPVLSSNTSSLPEILGGAAFYFNPYDIKDMAEKIITALNDSSLRARLISDGLVRIEKFSWKKMARETKKIYLEALNIL